ncbi:uncharacterized membrane protein YgaE (UPF0421/DUF939 family) [Variovorax boronicumulans]|uniref:hypothetical protein n=1 Tax=Variovorax boronicumulans TaxID=436515 RepID=UPI00278A1AEB|nr:hypothetical protein [Variovorax boronicumulans]MDQ0013593.1 uncharacterized membrane protein YgaE (UPF0421/DUF939 family) [Variovorax boronicumulans]
MKPPVSLILTCLAVFLAMGVGLIVISLAIAAVLPRGHRMGDHLREFAGRVPLFMLGGFSRLSGLIPLAIILTVIVAWIFL